MFRVRKDHRELQLQTLPFTGEFTEVQSTGRSVQRHTASYGRPRIKNPILLALTLEALYYSRSSGGRREKGKVSCPLYGTYPRTGLSEHKSLLACLSPPMA